MQIPDQIIRDISEAIIQDIDYSVVPVNSVAMAMNLNFQDKLGRAVLRKGSTLLGAQISSGKACLGIYEHITTSGTLVPLSVFNDATNTNADIYGYTGGSWAKVFQDITINKKVRFATFLDTTLAVNGTDKASTANGTTWVTTGGNLDVNNMPATTLVTEFIDRAYCAGEAANPDRLYFTTTPVSGAVTWKDPDTSDYQYIDVEPEEGAGGIVALAKVPGYLLIFKQRSLKRWDSNSNYPESLITLGTFSQESVVMARQACYYFNQKGVFETIGGYPRKISRRIQRIIRAIPSTYYSQISGWGDGDNVYFSIGNITLDGITYTNCVISYSLDYQNWALYSFPTQPMMWSKYIDSNGAEVPIVGDDNGNVKQLFVGADDSGTPISFSIEYQPKEIGSHGLIKTVKKTVTYTEKVNNGKISWKNEKMNFFETLKNLESNVQEADIPIEGRVYQFKIQGIGRECEIIGIDLTKIDVTSNYNH